MNETTDRFMAFCIIWYNKCKCQNLSVRERFKINMGWNPPIKKKINASFLLILITKITTIMSRWSTIKQVRTSETTREWYKARHKQRMPTDCHKKSNTWATKIGVNSTSTNQEYNLSKTPPPRNLRNSVTDNSKKSCSSITPCSCS